MDDAVGQVVDHRGQVGSDGPPNRCGRHRRAFGIAVLETGHRNTAVDVRPLPGQHHHAVARRRRQVLRRRRDGCRHRRNLRRSAAAAGVHRPHLEGMGDAVGQAADRHHQVGSGGPPGRCGRHRCTFGIAVLVAGHRGTAVVARRLPGQRHLALARLRRQVLRRRRDGCGRRRDLRRVAADAVAHRPHLEGMGDAVGQVADRHGQVGPDGPPGLCGRHRGAFGIAVLVSGHRDTAVVVRRLPDQHHHAVARRRRQVLRRRRDGCRHRRNLRHSAAAAGVHRPHLEGMGDAVGQAVDRHGRAGSGGLPGRCGRHRCAFGIAVPIAGHRGTVPETEPSLAASSVKLPA